jgi:hypothetical protein
MDSKQSLQQFLIYVFSFLFLDFINFYKNKNNVIHKVIWAEFKVDFISKKFYLLNNKFFEL